MRTWDEIKHKRFHGKFASMGLNRQTLAEKHKVHIHDNGRVYHHSGPNPELLGSVHMRADRKGYGAHIGDGEEARNVSNHPFRTKTEAAAAIAAVHPSVKTLQAPGEKMSPGEAVKTRQERNRGMAPLPDHRMTPSEAVAARRARARKESTDQRKPVKSVEQQIREVEALIERIQNKPYNPGVQNEYESARRLLVKLRKEKRSQR